MMMADIMRIEKLDEQFSVTGQIAIADIADLAGRGFRSVVCALPDGEIRQQPISTEMAAAASSAGLTFGYVPLESREVGAACLLAFRDIVENGEAPIIVYCRSGTRARALCEALGQSGV